MYPRDSRNCEKLLECDVAIGVTVEDFFGAFATLRHGVILLPFFISDSRKTFPFSEKIQKGMDFPAGIQIVD